MSMTAHYFLPIKTVTGLNAREHHMTRHRRVKSERNVTALVVKPFPTPCVVRLIRLSTALADDDNLPGACKAIRDEIAKLEQAEALLTKSYRKGWELIAADK